MIRSWNWIINLSSKDFIFYISSLTWNTYMLAFDYMLSLYKISRKREFTERKNRKSKPWNQKYQFQNTDWHLSNLLSFLWENISFFFQNFAKLPRSTLAHLGFWCSMYVNVFLLNYNYINLEIELDTSTCMFLNQPSL